MSSPCTLNRPPAWRIGPQVVVMEQDGRKWPSNISAALLEVPDQARPAEVDMVVKPSQALRIYFQWNTVLDSTHCHSYSKGKTVNEFIETIDCTSHYEHTMRVSTYAYCQTLAFRAASCLSMRAAGVSSSSLLFPSSAWLPDPRDLYVAPFLSPRMWLMQWYQRCSRMRRGIATY